MTATVTPERTPASVGEWPLHTVLYTCELYCTGIAHNRYKFETVPRITYHLRGGCVEAVSFLKRPPGSGSGLKNPLGLLGGSSSRNKVIVFQGGDDGRGLWKY